jgi:hypothetical protein
VRAQEQHPVWVSSLANAGAMPANVSDSVRARVTAGLAKLVDEVKKYASVIYAPTANGAAPPRPPRVVPNTTRSRPNVATTSASHKPALLRTWLEMDTAGNENIRLATTTPAPAPVTWATI